MEGRGENADKKIHYSHRYGQKVEVLGSLDGEEEREGTGYKKRSCMWE